jgi:hypothetical protein
MNNKVVPPKKVAPKKQSEEKSMRDRKLSPAEILLMRLGVVVIVSTIVIILGVVLLNTFNRDEKLINPLEDFTHITANEVEALIGYDSEANIYGNFDFFRNSESELYQSIDTLLSNPALLEIHVLFYKSLSLDETLEDKLLALFDTIKDEAFFLVDLDNPANQAIFDLPSLRQAGITSITEYAIITFFIEGKPFNDEIMYYEVYKDLRQIFITLDNI